MEQKSTEGMLRVLAMKLAKQYGDSYICGNGNGLLMLPRGFQLLPFPVPQL